MAGTTEAGVGDGATGEEIGGEGIDPRLVVGLATGQSHAEIGRAVGRAERTVRRWAKAPGVEEAVAEYRRELGEQAAGRMTALLDDAVVALRAGLKGSTSESLRAADLILRHHHQLSDEVSWRSRQAALAAELAGSLQGDDAHTGERCVMANRDRDLSQLEAQLAALRAQRRRVPPRHKVSWSCPTSTSSGTPTSTCARDENKHRCSCLRQLTFLKLVFLQTQLTHAV